MIHSDIVTARAKLDAIGGWLLIVPGGYFVTTDDAEVARLRGNDYLDECDTKQLWDETLHTKPRTTEIVKTEIDKPAKLSNTPVIRSENKQMATSVKTTVDRDYLTEDEVDRLIKAARQRRYGVRDATLILIAYRHGLRASELVSLRWTAVDFKTGRLHVHRLKGGIPSVQPLRGPEIRALRELRREYPDGEYLFQSTRKGPLSVDMVARAVEGAAEEAKIGFHVHPHMLRHSCGFKLANDGVDTRAIQGYLGHANIQHTVRYTALSSKRYENFWKD